MAEKQFIIKKKYPKKVSETPQEQETPPEQEQKKEPPQEPPQEPLKDTDTESSLFNTHLAKLKEKAESIKTVDEEHYKDCFIFGKYAEVKFEIVEKNDAKYILFLFSKKLSNRFELDKQRYREYVERRKN